MSDPTEPRWTPPDDTGAATGGPEEGTGREDTVRFATEETVRIRRSDPPPPPPPPQATGGWAPPPAPTVERSYGTGGWQPPPRPSRRTGLVVAVVVGVLVLVTLFGMGAVFLARVVDSGPVVDAPVADATQVPAPDADVPGAPDPQSVPADDLEAQAAAVLETINASEERMLAYQEAVFEAIGDDGTVGDAAAAVGQEAQQAGNDLTALRSDLRALAGGQGAGFDGLRDIRDTYAAHMDAWIDYVDAIAGSPAMAAPDSTDAEPFWRDIELTGDDFVRAVETGLPDDLPGELDELARFIVERGFGGFGTGTSGDVV
jgi:hypothetical protein